jgi:serine/threonine-protein kinase HipA
VSLAEVILWGARIGAVSIRDGQRVASFEYDDRFARSGIEVAPVRMPLGPGVFRFPGLPADAFHGLPGLLADALPDRWGRALVDAWLAAQGRDAASFDVVERLCYVGVRGMGALEFQPAQPVAGAAAGEDLELAELVRLANQALSQKEEFVAELSANPQEEAMKAILAIGTSAGGARPKALIAYNEATGQVRSGQLDAGPGFGHWLLKFDGVAASGDHGLTDPQGWGVIEYAYSRLAAAAGVTMSDCHLLAENGRHHFMTRRFDRPEGRGKLHVQTLGALEHVSYNEPGTYSYEQALLLARRLGLSTPIVEQLFRRMVFNIVARNQDDHVKNIAFLMDRDGTWSLAPAYDLTYANDPGNRWLNSHQMTLAGQRDNFTAADLRAAAKLAGLPRGRDRVIFDEVAGAVAEWPRIAQDEGIERDRAAAIAAAHRLTLPER